MKICVMGAGAWGTSLAILLADKPHEVRLWANTRDLYNTIVSNRENSIFFPGHKLPGQVRIEFDPLTASKDVDIMIAAVPRKYQTQAACGFAEYLEKKTVVLSVSKGIDPETSATMSQVLSDTWSLDESRIAVMSGPNFAKEVALHHPSATVIASSSLELAKLFQELLSTDYFRVYTSTDVLGVEIGGILKNVIAIGAGIIEGLGFGENTRAALVVRGLEEIGRLYKVVGASEKTLHGLSCLGDLVATCTSNLSRNKSFGVLLGQGVSPENAKSAIVGQGKAIEGLDSLEGLNKLASRYRVNLPIVEEITAIVNMHTSPSEAITRLMRRDLKSES
ncbi:MAG TPA: NAD(P)H-dependent glycerol-3-phosphate dehydrogenase [Caldisericia bacterium]|nr:NAD(P)H-dependent glycerol-3-phosphate dehydrogenase [Caldisericia bacterium]HPF48174.1 NAD(P)H-dependent glycerol-3-phosphate dehydrogenase [Caldisericia bacterium]HPI83890.1 NAD(P)H-dependent glycerol-3-phosphate dehydrogenase [Caldisericia bacterium]HPQ92627.1 NAD(P)H-dependent glycerol-3-phosphate dehydrogenase [Caldisericia bacterium]HRV74275.1 NAD(P)H-dependent glycerol-3-phosphate dehydrogenase [Caldisericia bacterium]